VTLTADVIAMFRYLSMWKNTAAGWILAGIVGGLAVLTTLVGLLLYRITINSSVSLTNCSWARLIIFPVGMLILAAYPAGLLESLLGGIFTALVGMIILFISTWALATTIFPENEMEFEDVFDDVASIYRKLKSRIKFVSLLEDFARPNWFRKPFNWLNPHKHKRNFIILIALLMGGILMIIEAFHEGVSTSATITLFILAIFLGMEGVGVVLGYLLFAEFLGIFRKE
jgi:hypothetical protein